MSSAAKTRLVCGANVQDAEGLVGKPLSAVRELYGDVLSIPPEAEMRVGGEPVGDDHVVQEDEQFEFVKPAGTKG